MYKLLGSAIWLIGLFMLLSLLGPQPVLAQQLADTEGLNEVLGNECTNEATALGRAYYFFSLAEDLEREGQLEEALRNYRLAEKCNSKTNERFSFRWKIDILDEWLHGELEPAVIEKYLRADNNDVPAEIMVFGRFFDGPDYYQKTKDVYFLLSAESCEEYAAMISGEATDCEQQSFDIRKRQQFKKEILWEALTGIYLDRRNEKKARQIINDHFHITNPTSQLERIARLYEDLAEFYEWTKETEKCQDSISQAIIYWEKSLESEWSEEKARKIISLYEKSGHIDKSVELWEQILKHDDTDSYKYSDFNTYLLKHGRNEQAINFFSRAVGQHPDDCRLHYYQAFALCKNGENDRAISALGKAEKCFSGQSASFPETVRTYKNFADLWFELGQQHKGEEAVVKYQKIIELHRLR